MLLADLVETSQLVGLARARRDKIDRLAALIRQLQPGEIETGVRYLAGVVPPRLGVGWAALSAAGGEAPPARDAELTVAGVARMLAELGQVAGRGSGAERRRLLGSLWAAATARERDFLLRLLAGELRQGALEGVMVEAIARAAAVDGARVRRALMLAGDLGVVAAAALTDGGAGLARFSLQLFRPLLPMLAQPADDAADAIARLGRGVFDYKLDGARVQVHKREGEVRVYSRGLREVTASVPELVECVSGLPARELVLDGEAVARRPDGRPQPFQVTMRRFGRKLDVAAQRQALPLESLFFDCLLVDGQSLLERPTQERLAALEAAVPAPLVIPRLITGDAAEVDGLLERALAEGHEGLMGKALDAPYEAGSRGAGWLKLKRARTFDLVVLAAEWGSGRRRGWLSNLHLGARDPAAGGFVMVGKTFKGLTDQMLEWQTRRLAELETSRERHVVWVRPELVVEIAIGDVQDSPRYPAGIALRFARVKRYRSDKSAAEADTVESLRALLA